MPSMAQHEYGIALDAVDELIQAPASITGGTVGAPKARQGAAISLVLAAERTGLDPIQA